MTDDTRTKNELYYGSKEPLPEQRELRAGPLTMLYENGDLRYIRLGKQEILRRVYVAIRDHNWNTIKPLLSNVRVDIDVDRFLISFDVDNRERNIHFAWHGEIRGEASGVADPEHGRRGADYLSAQPHRLLHSATRWNAPGGVAA